MLLAIDTSCYTTSMCVLDIETGKIIAEMNQNLKVKPGERGLRQSDGFFQHVNQLTDIFEQLSKRFKPSMLRAIAVSSRPRPIENSYMPVFHAGVLFCKNLSTALDIPMYLYSHQEGHLMAAIKTSDITEIPKHFWGLHLSGGTTEVLKVSSTQNGFDVHLLGGTLDLNFGQLIDRIGVLMGLQFPCGKEMDSLAQSIQHDDFFKIKTKDPLTFNISGLENKYMSLVLEQPHAYVCKHMFNTIASIIEQLIRPLEPSLPIILSGGVASNSIVKNLLTHKMSDYQLYFALPEYSRDNALGIAELGRIQFFKEHSNA